MASAFSFLFCQSEWFNLGMYFSSYSSNFCFVCTLTSYFPSNQSRLTFTCRFGSFFGYLFMLSNLCDYFLGETNSFSFDTLGSAFSTSSTIFFVICFFTLFYIKAKNSSPSITFIFPITFAIVSLTSQLLSLRSFSNVGNKLFIASSAFYESSSSSNLA